MKLKKLSKLIRKLYKKCGNTDVEFLLSDGTVIDLESIEHFHFLRDAIITFKKVNVMLRSEPVKTRKSMFAIVPRNSEDLLDFPLTESLGNTAEESWRSFCHPALNRKAFENDGFIAKEVIVEVVVV